MRQSAHRDAGLWSYDRPSRGYQGFHLRARNAAARARLAAVVRDLAPDTPHRLKLGRVVEESPKKWPRTDYPELILVLGDTPVADADALSLAIRPEARDGLADLLARVAFHGEASVEVTAGTGAMPLWVWWDAE